MKLRKLFYLSAITLGLVACSNDDIPNPKDGKADASISIKVYPASTGSQTRATGNLDGNGIKPEGLAAESEIKQLEAWIFNGDALEKYATVAGTEIKGIEVTSGPRTLVVVANANLETQPTLSGLKALTKDLSLNTDNGLVMTAEPLELALEAGENFYGYAGTTSTEKNYITDVPLALTRINARVAIVSTELNLKQLPNDQTHVFDGLADAQVAIFNVPKASNLFGTSLATNKAYLFGQAWPSTSGSYVSTTEGGTKEELLFDKLSDFTIATAKAPYYYVNENTAKEEKEQMLIVLRAKPTLNDVPVVSAGLYTDAEGYTYYPIWVNATKDGYTYTGDNTGNSKIIRNTQYNISLTVTGIGNPSIDPAETAFLDVKVEVKPWEVVSQNVVW